MQSLMTPMHIAKLRTDVADFARGKTALSLPDVTKHISDIGWNVASAEMFSEWLEQQGFVVDRRAPPVTTENRK